MFEASTEFESDHTAPVIAQVEFVEAIGRVASFRLPAGQGVPEHTARPLLLVAGSVLDLEIGTATDQAQRIQLSAGQVVFLERGVSSLVNRGSEPAQFTLVEIPSTPR